MYIMNSRNTLNSIIINLKKYKFKLLIKINFIVLNIITYLNTS